MCLTYNIKTHGQTRRKANTYILSSEYYAWRNMKDRCYNPNSPQYHDYEGRGITIHLD